MRTIKFRAWDEQKRIMHNDFQFIKSGDEGDDWIMFTSDKQKLGDKPHPFENPYFSMQLKVMQFAGLFDKNGKEIYEGDIVKNSNRTLLTLDEDPRTYLVIWKEGQYDAENKWLRQRPGFEFIKIQPKNKRYMELIFNQSQIEVIGNICENPELLNPTEGEKK